MIKISVKDLLLNCDAKLLIGSESKEINECFVDSKKVTKGSTFFGIKGENIDGSLFYKEAFLNGADICIINKIYDLDLNGFNDKTVIVANDTKKVLQQLATYKRSLFNGKVIGITGSIGKTTTKEMIANVLRQKYKVLKTNGNENSRIGLPLTILRLKDEDVMVLEMGMSNLGEMHNLSLIAKPDIAVITNVLTSHIGNLKTRENILKAKLEITDGMNNGTLIINNDNDMLANWYKNKDEKQNIITIGIKNVSDVMAFDIKEGIETYFNVDDINDLQVIGTKDLVYNALLAYKVSKMLGVEDELIKDGINTLSNARHRLEVIPLKNNIILIDDCYNASFESASSALKFLSMANKRKIAVLGDILELGKMSKKIHEMLAEEVVNNKVDVLITIGKNSRHISKKARHLGMKRKNIKHFKNEELSRNYIKKILKEEDTILIKASNGINLINLVEFLKEGLFIV